MVDIPDFLLPGFDNRIDPEDRLEILDAMRWAKENGIDIVTRQTMENYKRINEIEKPVDTENIRMILESAFESLLNNETILTLTKETGFLGVEPIKKYWSWNPE